MTINGGVKFFDEILNLEADGATVVAGTGDATSSNLIDRSPITIWRSVGSDDITTETITITMGAATTVTRIFIIDHNWKQFQIKYDTATDFSNVFGLDDTTAQSSISETAFSDNTAYYEFDSVSLTTLEITIDTTQTVDAEKRCNLIIVTTELGTLNGFPNVRPRLRRNRKSTKMLSGRLNIVEKQNVFNCSIRFRNYPTSLADGYQTDVSLMFTLDERNKDFLIWPSGGRRGTPFFNHTIRGFRLQDVFQVRLNKDLRPKYESGVYVNGVAMTADFVEVP